jgi:site-specific DNA recombinase
VRVVTISEGEVGHLHVGLKETMNALYLKDLAEKTRRGLRGRVEGGRSGGGRSYGYRVLRGADSTGARAIVEHEAAIVLQIFRDYVAGVSPRAIAKALNAARIPGPGSGSWGPSTIHGHAGRGPGVLNNELYVAGWFGIVSATSKTLIRAGVFRAGTLLTLGS